MPNWIVPCRRVAITSRCNYRDLIESWYHQCGTHSATLLRWYPFLNQAAIARGRTWLRTVYSQIDPTSRELLRPASVAVANTVNTVPHAYVRLWRGPHRVLHVTETDESLGRNNAEKEVRAYSAVFYPGDVVELPLHRFLAACIGDTSDRCRNFWNLRFNGDGSPFLGNTVLNAEGQVPRGEYALHECMLSMRFQLVLNLAICGFYRAEPVYRGNASQSLGSPEGQAIYARGMMYAGEFAIGGGTSMPTASPALRSWPSNVWRYGTRKWGETPNADVQYRYLPTEGSYANLLPDFPLTPGWACSPATIAMTSILLNRAGSGSDSVSASVRAHPENYPGVRTLSMEALANAHRPTPEERPPDDFDAALLPADGSRPAWNESPGDLTVIALRAHEQGMVRLYKPAKTMEIEQGHGGGPPHKGYMAAYNPVTGADFHTDDAFANVGMLYRWEATGALRRGPGKPQLYGAQPFKFALIENNTLYFRRSWESRRLSTHGFYWHGRPGTATANAARNRPTQHMSQMLCFDLTTTSMPQGYGHGEIYRPIMLTSNDGQDAPMSRNTDRADFARLYADRAVPFVTFDEYVAWARAYRRPLPNASALLEAIREAEATWDSEG